MAAPVMSRRRRTLVALAVSAACCQPARADSPMLVNPCKNASSPASKMAWCDSSLPIDDRVKDLVSHLTLAEKIGSLRDQSVALPSVDLPFYNWWSEATHGVSSLRRDATTPWTTSFAFPITTGMSFNRSLWAKTGAQIGREARAAMNAGNAYSTYWTPVVNLARDPRWGRNIEVPSEDPYQSGEYAVHFVKGFQEAPEDPFHLQASACCKHYVANEMEDSSEAGFHSDRFHFDANVTMQDLTDSYMLPFQACVERGRVSSLMCSYNAVNGVPSCVNSWLLQDVARDTWGFDGYITADCDADSDVFNSHHWGASAEEAVRDVLRAGTDVDCGSFVPDHAQSALDKGLITEADIDERLHKLFRVRMRLAHFDESPLEKIGTSEICSDYAKSLARDGVAQSAVLLKNADRTLPLNAATVKKAVVIGPNANLSEAITGYYGPSVPCDGKFWTMVDAMREYVPEAAWTMGVPSVSSDDTSQVAAAAELAKTADAVVLVVGTDLSMAMEGHDAQHITLSAGQAALIEAVAAAAAKPVVVVTITAVPLDLSALVSNPKVGAIIHAGQPAVQTPGVADVLFGRKVPAGRLVQTIYPASYADQISIFDFNMRPGPSTWPRPDCPQSEFGHCTLGTNPGRTHRFYTGQPVFPFGFGLSYTSFKYEVVAAPSELSLEPLRPLLQSTRHGFFSTADVQAAGPAASYTVKVTNTGSVDADEVVLGFLVPPGAGKDGTPLQTLFGFERVHVKAGETATVTLYPSWADFTLADAQGQRRPAPGGYTVRFGVPQTKALGGGFAERPLRATFGQGGLRLWA